MQKHWDKFAPNYCFILKPWWALTPMKITITILVPCSWFLKVLSTTEFLVSDFSKTVISLAAPSFASSSYRYTWTVGEPRLSASLGRPSGVNVCDSFGFLEVRPRPGNDGESRFSGKLTPADSAFRGWLPDDNLESGFEPTHQKPKLEQNYKCRIKYHLKYLYTTITMVSRLCTAALLRRLLGKN